MGNPDESGAELVSAQESEVRTGRRALEHRILLCGSWLGLFGMIALGFFLEPDARGHGTHEQLGLRPCYPLVSFDVPCPGCGVTTSVVRLIQGDLWGSIVTQPMGTLLALGTLGFAIWALVVHVRGRDLWMEINRLDVTRLGMTLVALGVIAWVYKIAQVRGWF